MKGIDYWRLADELTIIQAALLICGYDPTPLQNDLAYEERGAPEGFSAVKHALASAVKSGRLSHNKTQVFNQNDGEYYPDDNLALVQVGELKDWLLEKNIRQHFFFFPEEPEGEFLSKSHPRYSPKLAAAVKAWQALDDETLHVKTAKQSVKKWLRLHSTEYELSDEDGKPIETAIEEVAKIVNWNPKGGAPLTPSGVGSVKPTPATNVADKFSILKERKKGDENLQDFDLDSEIPF